MKASEMITELQNLVAVHGDKEVAFDDGWELRAVAEVEESAEEDDCFCLR